MSESIEPITIKHWPVGPVCPDRPRPSCSRPDGQALWAWKRTFVWKDRGTACDPKPLPALSESVFQTRHQAALTRIGVAAEVKKMGAILRFGTCPAPAHQESDAGAEG